MQTVVVRIHPPQPFYILHTLEDQVEGLSVCGVNTYGVDFAVRKYNSEQ